MGNENKEKNSQPQTNKIQTGLLIVGILTMFFIAWQSCQTTKSVNTQIKQTKLMNKSVQSQIEYNNLMTRPWLSVDFKKNPLKSYQITEDQESSFYITTLIKNIGNTPAYNISGWIEIDDEKHNLSLGLKKDSIEGRIYPNVIDTVRIYFKSQKISKIYNKSEPKPKEIKIELDISYEGKSNRYKLNQYMRIYGIYISEGKILFSEYDVLKEENNELK